MLRALAIALLLLGVAARADAPALTQRVTDLTGTLTSEQRAQLESRSAALEKAKGAQLVVLVVPTTQPETIEAYALAVAEKNRIGRKGSDDGVLLLVAKDDRKARIEVGYGLEGAIPDVVAHRIIAEYLAPRFRAGDFYGGLDESSAALAKLIEGEPLPPPLEPARGTPSKRGGSPLTTGIFAGVLVAFFLRGLRSTPRPIRALAGGAFGGAVGWWMTTALAGAAAGALAAALVGLLGIGGGLFTGGRGRYGGWGGGLGGWGGGGGGLGGGGWSGGGGGFGGGGSSGSW
jgi:uncharacterized protein